MGRWGTAVLALLGACVVAVAAVAVVAGPRGAGWTLSVALAGLALLRAVLPVRVAGPLAVRSRTVDVACTLGLAGAVGLLTWAAPL